MILCLCSDPRADHPGDGECIHRACGCDWFRLDYRSRLNPVQDSEDAATGDEAA